MMNSVRKIARWKRRIKPEDVDRLIDRVNVLSKVTGTGGISVSTGMTGVNIHNRFGAGGGRGSFIMEVQSAAAGDGLYTCRKEKLLAAEWSDTAGDDKFSEKAATEYTVLNLMENDPEPGYVAHLIAGSLMECWQMADDGGTSRWVGIPVERLNTTRRAWVKTTPGAVATVVCYLDVNTTGTEITVNCDICGGTALNAATPRLSAGDEIYPNNIGGTWRAGGFQATEDCECTPSLDDLANVTITAADDHDFVVYDSGTSEWIDQTPAQVLAALTGTAGAAFSWNSQNLTSVGAIGCGAITSTGLTVTNATVIGSDSVVFQPNSDSTTFLQVLDADGGTPILNVDTTNERVGIGTVNPGAMLEIQSSSPVLRLRDTGAIANATTAFVEFGGTEAAAWSRTGFVGDASSGDTDIYLCAEVNDLHLGDSSGVSVLNLQGGNVGIGLTTVDANYKLIIRRAANVNLGIGLQSSELALAAFNDALSANVPMRFYASEFNFLNGNVGIGETAPETLTEWKGTAPYLTLHNSTEEDTDGGGEVRIIGKREDGAGTETAAGQIEISHDGVVANDQLGRMKLSVNTGAGLVQALEIGSDLLATFAGAIGCGAITSTGSLGVTVAGNTAILQNTTDAVSNQVAQFKAGNRATAANNDSGYLSLFCDDDAGTQVEVARLKWLIADVSSGGETGALDIQLADGGGGTFTSMLFLDENNSRATFNYYVRATAFHAKDPTSGFYLKIQADADKYAADRLLEIDLNDANRVVTFGYSPLVFNQPVDLAASPTFVGLTLTGNLLVDGGDIGITGDENLMQLAANALTVNGAILVSGLQHIGDADTGITMLDDRWYMTAGGITMLELWEQGLFPDKVTVNPDGVDVDFMVESLNNTNCLVVNAGNDNVTINAGAVSAHYDLMLAGDGVLGLKEGATPTADAAYGKVYCKDTNKLYFQDGAGAEHELAFA